MHRKLIVPLLSLCLAMTATHADASAGVLELTFNRTGTAASSVTVTANGIDGVTAEMTAVSHAMKGTSGNVTSSILCPNVNGNTSPTITMEFRLQGIPAGFSIEDINLDIHALNGSNGYQEADDGKVRQFNVVASINDEQFGTLDNIDIANNVNPSGAQRHKIWSIFPMSSINASSPVTLKLTITKGTANEGCFFGLSSIRFNTPVPEVVPFNPSPSVGNASDCYYIQNADDYVLSKSLDWTVKKPVAEQKWYFVGTSNDAGGYQIVNAIGDEVMFDGKRFTVAESQTNGLFVLTGDDGTPLSINGFGEFRFSTFRDRNAFAMSAQIYALPCGSLGRTYVTSATVKSIDGYNDLHYPMGVQTNGSISYPQATRPTERYTMLSRDYATVAAGVVNVELSLNAEPSDNDRVFLYFDWDRDGYFENMQEVAPSRSMQTDVTVPATASLGMSRMRIRITDNGLTDADDDVVGQVIDLFLNCVNATAASVAPVVTVNAADRGTAVYDENSETASATPKGTSVFLYWREGNRIHSVDRICEVKPAYTQRTFTAMFSPNLGTAAIDELAWNTLDSNAMIEVDGRMVTVTTDSPVEHIMVFALNGALVCHVAGSSEADVAALASGVYIVKAVTGKGAVAAKIVLN